MVAFNFKKQFANKVENGGKRQSIRRNPKCRPLDKLQLYTGQRTKACRKLGEAICKTVTFVRIDWESLLFEVPQGFLKVESKQALNKFSVDDGFKDWRELCDFFYNQYGNLPFDGYLHTWEQPTPANVGGEK